MTTTIQISDSLWETLNKMKTKRGETFEDVILKIIENGKTKIPKDN